MSKAFDCDLPVVRLGPVGDTLATLASTQGLSVGGSEGADIAYVTTSAAVHGSGGAVSNINFDEFPFRRWTGDGELKWNRATWEQLPLSFHVVNGMADLDIVEIIDAELVHFSGPGVGIAMKSQRPRTRLNLIERI